MSRLKFPFTPINCRITIYTRDPAFVGSDATPGLETSRSFDAAKICCNLGMTDRIGSAAGPSMTVRDMAKEKTLALMSAGQTKHGEAEPQPKPRQLHRSVAPHPADVRLPIFIVQEFDDEAARPRVDLMFAGSVLEGSSRSDKLVASVANR